MILEETHELPGTQWLGYALDMTTLAPLNMDAVQASIIQAYRLVKLQEPTRPLEIASVTYTVPGNVHVHNIPSVQSSFHVYNTGNLATAALQGNTSLAASFLAVSLNTSASHAIQKCFQDKSQYALYSQSSLHCSLSLRDYGEHLDEGNLKRRVSTLPIPFEPSSDTIEEYKRFFATFGSHVIVGVSLGARLQVCASSPELYSRFSTLVKAALHTLLPYAELDLSIKETKEYQMFYAGMQTEIAVRGGDPKLQTLLAQNLVDQDLLRSWVNTHDQRADVIGVQTQEIWNLVEISRDPDVAKAAQHIQAAYRYIVTHPATHVTCVRFTILSDWGTFGLLSAGAVITPDPTGNKGYPGNITIESNGVRWGHDSPFDVVISFIITNDGSPIHFHTGRGDKASKNTQGRTEVVMNGQSYVNGDTENGWNIKNFYNCAVNPRSLEASGRPA